MHSLSFILTISAASVFTASGVASQSHRIDFDNGGEGDLSIVFHRDAPTMDGEGAHLPVDSPRFGLPCAVTSLGSWTHAIQRSMNAQRAWIGDSRDGARSVLAILDTDSDALLVWDSEAIEGEPAMSFSMDRVDGGVHSQDVLADTPQRRDDAIYYPKAGVVLPGCVLLLCPRKENTAGDGSDPIWVTHGVSLLALQEAANGVWSWSVVHDAPGLPGAVGWDRVLMPAMSAYYPTDGQETLHEAFIPFVDYIRHLGASNAPGGQAFLTRASRDSVTSPWTFDPVKTVFEQHGFGLHFHSAAWTPNGYILSIGDNRVNNEVKRFMCSDWSQYWFDDVWTQQDRFHGAQTYETGASQIPANQFWGCVPGTEINTILVGGDVTSGTVFQLTVPEEPSATAIFTRMHGQEFGESGSSAGASNTCEWLIRPRPERSMAVLARTRGTLSSSQTPQARLIYSPDGVTFSTCAAIPGGGSKASIAVLDESAIYLPSYQSPDSMEGIWSMPVPDVVESTRPLEIGGGGRNYLMLDDEGRYLDPVAINAVDVSIVQEAGEEGVHPVTGEPMHVPTFSPVVRVRSTGATSRRIWDITLTDPTVKIPHGRAIIPMWVNVLGNEMVRLRAYLRDGAARDSQLFLLAERDQWSRIALVVDMVEEGPFETPQFRLQVADDDDETYDVDLMIAIEGLFIDDIPGYPVPPSSRGDTAIDWHAPEDIEIALEAMNVPCSLVIDGVVPPLGIDETLGVYIDQIALAELPLGDGSHLLIGANPSAASLVVTHLPVKGPPTHVQAEGFHIARLDRFWLSVILKETGVTVMARCGGDRGTGVVTASLKKAVSPPTSLRIGGNVPQPPLMIRSVIADPYLAYSLADIDAVLAGRLPCHDDISGDGRVGTVDLLLVIEFWGACDHCSADLDGDGWVGTEDLLRILGNWGECPR